MNQNETIFEEPQSHLKIRCIFGFMFMALGLQDLLAWAEVLGPEIGWINKVTGIDLQPVAGLALFIAGAAMGWRPLVDCFSGRDRERNRARRLALACAAVCGLSLLFSIETLAPSRFALTHGQQRREAKRAALAGLALAAAGLACFVLARRRDVGFWQLLFPLQRENEIWKLSIKAEVAFRALPQNQEAYQMLTDRAEFLQAQVGGKFDQLCQQLIKESADLSTIDSTARLQMDVGHIFKRYADFHARLATTRHRLCEELMRVTSEAVMDVIENRLPGQHMRAAGDRDLKVSISYPVLQDTEALKKRRTEWDQTLRGVVEIGAATGNQIIGEWIDRAARGDISADEMPTAVQLIRSLCQHSESSGRTSNLALPANSNVTPSPRGEGWGEGDRDVRTTGRLHGNGQTHDIAVNATPMGLSTTAKELHDWIGTEGTVEDPKMANRVRSFFATKRLLLPDCDSPEVSAELLMALLRSEFSGLLTLTSIASVLSRRGV